MDLEYIFIFVLIVLIIYHIKTNEKFEQYINSFYKSNDDNKNN